MSARRTWTIINVSLIFIGIMLVLNLLNVSLPTFGKAQYWIDKEEPLCVVNWKEGFNQWDDLDRCCFESLKQLDCYKEKLFIEGQTYGFDWVCRTDGGVKYWLNNKAYNYCRTQLF